MNFCTTSTLDSLDVEKNEKCKNYFLPLRYCFMYSLSLEMKILFEIFCNASILFILQKSADSNEVPLPPIPSESGPKPPLPPTAPGANIQIRRGYDPKAPKAAAPQVQPDKFLISPITGERVPAENMAEHMKISLLDPRWREQRDRVLQEKKEQEQVFAEGKLTHNLKVYV